jgi:O-antigen/teichoic acid export membrane protein
LSNIRVTYTGLISFIVALITIVTGIGFTLILTRTLNPEEYGTWGLILGLISYVAMSGVIISFWATRETARGIDSGKTAVLGNMLMSIGAIIVYIFIAYFMSDQTGSSQTSLLLSTILIPVIFLNGIFTAINLGWKPHVISYGTLSFGISQTFLVFLLVFQMDLGLTGVIFSTFGSYVISILILFLYARSKISGPFIQSYLKKWLKLSWLPMYPSLPIIIDGLGIAIFSILTQSVIGLAFWTAALVLPSIISHTGLISRGVYPKLLEGGNKSFLQNNISQLFYFSFLMTGMVITFAKPALFALNPIYEPAFIIVIILALRNFFIVFTNISIQNLTGVENIDINNKANFKDFIKSQLFYPHSLRLVQTIIFITILTGGLFLLINYGVEEISLLLFWAILSLLTQIPLSFYLFRLMNKKLEIKFPLSSVIKYFIILIPSFGTSYVLYQQFLIPNENPLEFIPRLLIFVIIGVIMYLGLSLLIDSKTRLLAKSILQEIRGKKS